VVEGKPMGSRVVVIQEVLPSLLPPGPLGYSSPLQCNLSSVLLWVVYSHVVCENIFICNLISSKWGTLSEIG
jgi:hypothetical protein